MKNVLYILIILFLPAKFLFGQSPIWKYAKTGSGEYTQDFKADSLGNLYIAADFSTATYEYQDKSVPGMTGNESSNLLLLKTDPTGRSIWMHSIIGNVSGANVNFNDMTINERGELVVAFTISNCTQLNIDRFNVVVDQNQSNQFVAKFSKTGYLVWIKHLFSTGSSTPSVSIGDLLIDEAGNTYLAGGFTGTTCNIGGFILGGLGDYSMMFVARINPRGEMAWANTCQHTGPSGNIFANYLNLSESGTLLISGSFSDYIMIRFGNDSIYSDMSTSTFIAGYTPTGTALWGRFITGSLNEYPGKILVCGKTDVYLTGYSNSNPTNIDGHAEDNSGDSYNTYILHLNTSGAYINHKVLTTQFPNSFSAKIELSAVKENNILLATEFYSSQILSTLATIINPEPGTSDIVFAKLSGLTLEPLWSVHGTGAGDNYLDNTFIDKLGNITMAGNLYKNTTIDGNTFPGSSINGNPYLVRINSAGAIDYSFQKSNGINNFMTVSKTASDIYGNTYIMGSFTGPDNTLGDNVLTRPSNNGMFLAKYVNSKNICGHVYDPMGEPVNEGYVKIFGYTYFQKSPLNDSIPINSDGSYCFNELPFGRYIICAVTQREFENQYIPTYYPSEINWQYAEKISIIKGSKDTIYDIQLINRTSFDGYSGISGNLQQADSNNIYKTTASVQWKPSKRATVVLASKRKLKATDEFYAESETDDAGNFSFVNVPSGYYYVWVEIPGLPSDEYYVQVINGYIYGSVDFLIDEEEIYTSGGSVIVTPNKLSENENWIYPNPANNWLKINLPGSETISTIEIIDSKGSIVVKTSHYEEFDKIDISQLNAGVYFIKVITPKYTKLEKISISH